MFTMILEDNASKFRNFSTCIDVNGQSNNNGRLRVQVRHTCHLRPVVHVANDGGDAAASPTARQSLQSQYNRPPEPPEQARACTTECKLSRPSRRRLCCTCHPPLEHACRSPTVGKPATVVMGNMVRFQKEEARTDVIRGPTDAGFNQLIVITVGSFL